MINDGKISKEREHEIKLLIKQLDKAKSSIESIISSLTKELKEVEK